MIAGLLETARKMLRAELEHTFSAEIAQCHRGAPESSKRDILDALEVSASFETWDQLRHLMGRSKSATTDVVEQMMLGILQPQPSSPLPKGSKKRQR